MEDLIPLVAILSPFVMVVAIVVWPKIIRAREQREMQATVRAAIDKGQPLPPELIEAMTTEVKVRQPSSRSRDIRQGIIWLAVGVGLAAFGLISDASFGGGWDSDFDTGLLGLAAIPATVGLAYIALSFFNKNKD